MTYGAVTPEAPVRKFELAGRLKRGFAVLHVGKVYQVDDLRRANSEDVFSYLCCADSSGRATVSDSVTATAVGRYAGDSLTKRFGTDTSLAVGSHLAKSASVAALSR